MGRTTIEIDDETKERLREERLSFETNYDETITRLLDGDSTEFPTEEQAREIATEVLKEWEDELREIARQEAREAIQEHSGGY